MPTLTTPPKSTPDASKGSGKGGQFLGEDLAKLVTLGSDITALGGGATLNDYDAQSVLAKRLGRGADNNSIIAPGDTGTSRAADAIEVIVDALPPELHTQAVLDAIDLRPYLKALDGKDIVKRSDSLGFSHTDHGKIETLGLLDEHQKSLVAAADALTSSGTLSQSDRNYRKSQVLKDPGTTVGVAPLQQPDAVTALTGQGGEYDPTKGPAAQQAINGGFHTEDFRRMVDNNMWTLQQLMDNEAAVKAKGQQGFFPVQMDLPNTDQQDLSHFHGQQTPPVKGISTSDAVHYLRTLTPDQVKDMQNKLGAAGYFDKVKNGGFYQEGDSLDPATMEAWQLLLTDSIKQNQPASQVLVDQAKTYRNEARASRLKGMETMDPTYNRVLADDYAQSVIGRSMTSQETEQMEKFMMTLRNNRAGYVQGAHDNVANEGLQGTTGVTKQDMETYVKDTTGGEQGTESQAARSYALSKVFK